MTFLQQTTEAWTQDDQSWLGSAHGTQSTRTGTLDTSAFVEATHYPNGYFPSGLAVKLSGTLYVPALSTDVDYAFLFCAVKAPSVDTIDVVCALLDHGRIVVSRLPIAVTGAALTNPHFIFVA